MDAVQQSFQQLQNELRRDWCGLESGGLTSDYDILVVPSLSLDAHELQKISGVLFYEERLLFSLIRLRDPRTRVIYVTSEPLPPLVIDYYLQLLPGIPFSHARDRLLLLSTCDSSLKPLTQKILERPRLLERIRRALRPGSSFMTCFNSSPLERELSVALRVPLFAADPDLLEWGTKAGSRSLFAECGLPHPAGSPLMDSVEDLAAAAAELWQDQPQAQRFVIKLNQGFSGEGNALLDLRPIAQQSPDRVGLTAASQAIAQQFPVMRFQAAHETWQNFKGRIADLGAIAELFIEGEVKRSPSVQGCIHPSGQVEILSTHDQILGGPDGQIYLGCRFPADPAYRLQLQTWGQKIGEALAERGALERFGVDFVAVHQGGDHWELEAIEINLRKGGTTHPFMTLKYLTNGYYDRQTGQFCSELGQPKSYVATDNLQSPRYRGLLPQDLMDIIAANQLHFDSSTKTGTVFHLMGCLSQYGKLGLTSIGNSPEQAQAIYDEVVAVLDRETDPATSPTGSALPLTWAV
ncbi:peptide ligase PGM1-related protein [Synechococcus elongatus]|uniref:Peptide ligase PGM1-related protein n=1 Tax=Synechococcus elongatus PCC 11801 TaxID=2219813 RepID=A0AAN1QL97_SYNEL|nr:peptide ligase PGM1-related protein [Synechococcus elongatus]AZB71361.1 carboxylate-amine ligase [Synechococcus elongatus PCC 11801]